VADPAVCPVSGLSHVQLWVSDVEVSAGWYTTALGLEPYSSDPEIGYVALRHPASRVVVVLTRADAPPTASPGTGPVAGSLDHLAFAVADGTVLDAWAAHLTRAGIDHPGVVSEGGNPSLQLRDPDGTAIELVAPGPKDA
jgi:glyoxylase I family protein